MRVHEVAKDLNLTSKALVNVLDKLGISGRSHASTITDEELTKIKEYLQGLTKTAKQSPAAEPVAPPEPVDNSDPDPAKSATPATSSKSDESETDDFQVFVIDKETFTVKDFAETIKIPLTEVMTLLIKRGMMLNLNQNIDFKVAAEIAQNYNIILDQKLMGNEDQQKRVEDVFLAEIEEDERFLKERPPVVTVMGHVDHGKTKLLDAIRKKNVVASEAGGITQHIGAYQVKFNEKEITFIDTPGHEAFTEIRARGANITDIVILVVAADDGVMPQTVEAINHAKAAKVPILVAINKMDKADANPDRVRQQLTEFDLVAEDWGGQTIMVPISAIDGTGIEDLLEMILLVAETEELKANPHKQAVGIILESNLSKEKGAVATVLIKSGTLRVGNPFVIGPVFGKVRAMFNEHGEKIQNATPAMPVEIMGLSSVPNAGDVLQVLASEKETKRIADNRSHELANINNQKKRSVTIEEFTRKIQDGEIATLNILVKADVQGSLEAILGSLQKIKMDNAAINIVHSGTGSISKWDVKLASASDAIVVGFNVTIPLEFKNKAEEDGVSVRLYHIIYKLLEDIEAIMKGMLKPEYEKVHIGTAEVRQLFKFSKVGVIAGCYISSGKMLRGADIEIVRDDQLVYDGELSSLKRFKEDVKEVQSGYECGIVLDGFNDFKEGDEIRVFQLEEIKV